MAGSLEELISEYHDALAAVVRGDPEPQKALWSREDDASLANPLGPPGRGWAAITERLERACELFRDGEMRGFERISGYATADVGWIVEIERCVVKIAGSAELSPVALRVTTIFRREDDGWRVVHRHADPLAGARPPSSLVAASP